jgi:hypothetical protein
MKSKKKVIQKVVDKLFADACKTLGYKNLLEAITDPKAMLNRLKKERKTGL